MVTSLRTMRDDARPNLMNFVELRDRIGFGTYYEESESYSSTQRK
jgi:hypothetical protein